MRIGYIRVSSVDQNADRQLADIQLDQTFLDRKSGKDTDRPELQRMMEFARDGDTVFVHSLDRLGRNLSDLEHIIRTLTDKKVVVTFIKESLTFTGEDSPISMLLLRVMGAVAQFERELIRERQREGIALAIKNRIYKGRKPALTVEQVKEARGLKKNGVGVSTLARRYAVNRTVIYNALKMDDSYITLINKHRRSS